MRNVIAKLLSFVRVVRNEANVSDVKIDPGGGANITSEHFAPPGDDSFPLPGDYVLGVDVPRSGSKCAAGYIDPVNTPKANEGDKRIYGRKADGTLVNEVWLKNDGSILVSNDNGSILLRADGSIKSDNGSGFFELKTSGDIDLNGVNIDPSGNILCPTTIIAVTSVSSVLIEAVTPSGSLMVQGKEMKGHTHTQANDSGGNTEQNTGGPV